MQLVSQALELSRIKAEFSERKVHNFRCFYFPQMEVLGLDHQLSSIDVNLKVGGRMDDPDLIRDWSNFLATMPKAHTEYYSMYQRHTDFAVVVDEEGLGDASGPGRKLDEPDGLITSRPDFLLSSSFADCAPLLIFDPQAKVQANVHSGWRGTLANIGGNTLRQMIDHYSLDPQNIYVAIGPHIGRDDFEVDLDVAEPFLKAYPELAPYLVRLKHISRETDDPYAGGLSLKDLNKVQAGQKYLVDLNLCIIYNLLKAGVRPDHIFPAHRSTVAEPQNFHSYRRDKANFGLMMVLSQIR
ncbi:MAG: polyphenol oxidase family protein [Eubacteriales bacterium]|nr:polyphenol oxidase family protein [Eubacteriales bacterium]